MICRFYSILIVTSSILNLLQGSRLTGQRIEKEVQSAGDVFAPERTGIRKAENGNGRHASGTDR
jgi:hypothetical protein